MHAARRQLPASGRPPGTSRPTLLAVVSRNTLDFNKSYGFDTPARNTMVLSQIPWVFITRHGFPQSPWFFGEIPWFFQKYHGFWQRPWFLSQEYHGVLTRPSEIINGFPTSTMILLQEYYSFPWNAVVLSYNLLQYAELGWNSQTQWAQ